MTETAGTAARLRAWYFEAVLDESRDAELDPELAELVGDLREKLQLLEGLLPLLGRMIGLQRVSSIVDLFPDGDEEAAFLLELLHGWSGRMLDPAAASSPADGRSAGDEAARGADPA